MKRILSFFFALVLSATAFADPIADLLGRILPENGDAQRFSWSLSESDNDQFTLTCDGTTITVSGNNYVSIATGINWYLQHYAGIDISWNNPSDRLPNVLPACAPETHVCCADYRYYLNFCTHSYTMAFWGWERWQQEIDWMALHGINLPLIITGMECVWRDVLINGYGYASLDGVNEFVTGSAYYGWFFMNNMTAWGGPQPENWFTQREALAKQIFKRLSEFGMTPVVPGYVGMVPKNFLSFAAAEKVTAWTAADIVSGGSWNAFERPYFVKNNDRLREFGAQYYAAMQRVFGDVLSTHYYAIDPFHEGGVPSGVSTPAQSVQAMYDALLAYDNEAIWVAQHWQENPGTYLTRTVPAGRLLILDLHGDSSADTQCGGNNSDASGKKHDWIWGHTSNFGGNVGLFGRMERIISCYYGAQALASSSNFKGVGTLPEGIENNAVLYDLIYALPWANETYTLNTWLEDYVKMRYGLSPEADRETFATMLSAWKRLATGIYNCPINKQQGTTESVFLMRPATSPGVVSTWAQSSWYWDFNELRTALFEMLSLSNRLAENNNYRYDLVDVMRQVMADYGKQTLDSIANTNVAATRRTISKRFLQLILDQDTLLGTRTEFRLGRWIEMARALGQTDEEKALYEKNARMLLTTWGDRAQCETGKLHDYANREWQGLLSSYYYPRWAGFVARNFVAQQWFTNYEWPFATGISGIGSGYLPEGAPYAYGTFTAEAVGDEIETVRRLYDKYFSAWQPDVYVLSQPDFTATYRLTNAEKWYSVADTEGLCLTVPNSDYSGYRLKRAALKADDDAYLWQFETSPSVEGAVRLKNVLLTNLSDSRYGAYLSSTPSTAGYPAYTFSASGSDYYLYQSGENYYLTDAATGACMSPDVAWAEACVLVGSSRTATSLLHLQPVTPTGITIRSVVQSAGARAYDLQGRPATEPFPEGVYVVGGKKVLMN